MNEADPGTAGTPGRSLEKPGDFIRATTGLTGEKSSMVLPGEVRPAGFIAGARRAFRRFIPGHRIS